jgi:aspartyl aminopeptidase
MAYAAEFAAFLTKSGTPYNFCELARSLLLRSGYTELSELQCCVALPSKFFVVRDGKSFLAFHLDSPASAVIIGAHNDSPVLKLKPDSLQTFSSALRTMAYAGGLAHSAHGRDLRLAGAVLVRSPDLPWRVIDDPRPICTVPFPSWTSSESEVKCDFDREFGMNAIWSVSKEESLLSYISTLIGVPEKDIVGSEISLVDSRPATVYGDFILSSRIDDLGSAYAALKGFLAAPAVRTVNVCAVFDAEEIGSRTRTGAMNDFFGI